MNAETEFQLNLVLEELLVNAVRHGGCEGLDDAACIRLTCGEGGVHVDFRDRGVPFDLTAAPPARLDEARVGGLGIHLVRQIMREVSYRRVGEWNVLTMRQPVPERQETL